MTTDQDYTEVCENVWTLAQRHRCSELSSHATAGDASLINGGFRGVMLGIMGMFKPIGIEELESKGREVHHSWAVLVVKLDSTCCSQVSTLSQVPKFSFSEVEQTLFGWKAQLAFGCNWTSSNL